MGDAVTSIPEGVEYWKQPDYDGWMQSQGEHIKTWRKRWFVLKDGYLFRFLNDKVLPQSKPRGIINLGLCLEISKPAKDVNQGATLQITVQKKRALSKGDLLQNILFVADSKPERDLWVEIMNRAKTDIQKAKESSSKKGSDTKSTSDNARLSTKYEKAHKEWMQELDQGFKSLQKHKKPDSSADRSASAGRMGSVEVVNYEPVGRSYSPSAPHSNYSQPVHQTSYTTSSGDMHANTSMHTQGQASSGTLDNWKVCYTPDGRAYYYNTVTGITQWEAP